MWVILITIVLLISLCTSYVWLCWVLSSHLTLPNPQNFWAYRVPLNITRAVSSGRLSVSAESQGIPLDHQEPLRVSSQEGRCFKALSAGSEETGRLLISLNRGHWLNLLSLLTDNWGRISTSSQFSAANFKDTQPSTAQICFRQLTIVELQPNSSDGNLSGTAWFLEPREGTGAERSHAPVKEVQAIIDELAEEIRAANILQDRPHHADTGEKSESENAAKPSAKPSTSDQADKPQPTTPKRPLAPLTRAQDQHAPQPQTPFAPVKPPVWSSNAPQQPPGQAQ